MLWHAMPPELTTARLMAGVGPAPMMQAAAGWEALSAALETQAVELATALVGLSQLWTGMSGEHAIAAVTPMVVWLHTAAEQAQQRALQAAAQAASYLTALGMTPSLPEIAGNHITHAVLTATNFLGINTVPIGFNEVDYFVRMWNQAAGSMDVYQAETVANTTFEPLPPMKPILAPGVGDAVKSSVSFRLAAMASETAPELSSDFPTLGSGGLIPTTPAEDVDVLTPAEDVDVLTPAEDVDVLTPAEDADVPFAQPDMDFIGQMGQLVGPMQQLSDPLQQVTSLFSQTGNMGKGDQLGHLGDTERAQVGLVGASPLSNHPLAGGSGPSMGAGLLRARSLPGAGGSLPRTPLMAQLIDKPSAALGPTALAPRAPGAPSPVGAGAGSSAMGGAAPMGVMGHGAQSGGSRPGLAAPALLARDEHENDYEYLGDLDDEDAW